MFLNNKEFLKRYSYLNEADDYIDQNDVQNIKNGQQADSQESIDIPDPNLEDENEEQGGEDQASPPSDNPNQTDDNQDPNSSLDSGTGMDSSLDSTQEKDPNEINTPQSDSIKKVKLFEFYQDIYVVSKDLLKSLENIPIINEEGYKETLKLVRDNLNDMIETLEYVMKYEFNGQNYLTNRKNFIVFKTKLLLLGSIVQTIFIYNKSKELETLKTMKKLSKQLKISGKLTRIKNIYNNKKYGFDYN